MIAMPVRDPSAPQAVHGGGLQLLQFALHELQMNVQGVERIADFVRHAGGQQGQRLDAFALDGFEGLLPRFGRVVKIRPTPALPAASPSSGAA